MDAASAWSLAIRARSAAMSSRSLAGTSVRRSDASVNRASSCASAVSMRARPYEREHREVVDLQIVGDRLECRGRAVVRGQILPATDQRVELAERVVARHPLVGAEGDCGRVAGAADERTPGLPDRARIGGNLVRVRLPADVTTTKYLRPARGANVQCRDPCTLSASPRSCRRGWCRRSRAAMHWSSG